MYFGLGGLFFGSGPIAITKYGKSSAVSQIFNSIRLDFDCKKKMVRRKKMGCYSFDIWSSIHLLCLPILLMAKSR